MKNFILFSFIVFQAFSSIVIAQGGKLDSTFAGDGIAITQIADGLDYAYAVTLQSDGKIIVGGTSYMGDSDRDYSIARFNTDGTLDTDFGVNGKTIIPVCQSFDIISSVAIQPNGYIIAAGRSWVYGLYYSLVRLNADGKLDTNLNHNGIITNDFTGMGDQCQSVAIQSDGKIIAAGSAYSYLAVVRYNQDGGLDNTFAEDGSVIERMFETEPCRLHGVAIQPDGKIVGVGYTSRDETIDFMIVRLNEDGTFDNSFGENGKVNTTLRGFDDASCVKILSDGKIIVGGSSSDWHEYDFALAKYNSDGSLDASFGTNGYVTTPIGDSDDFLNSIDIASDGKIVAGGYTENNGQNDIAIVRYNPDGTLDNTFGSGGKVVTVIDSTYEDEVYGIAIQDDDNIIAAGYARIEGSYYYAVLRYSGESNPVSVEHEFDKPNKFKLYPNYPNPFNPTTTIEFTLGEKCSVDLTVFNIVGKEIANLINKQLDAGNHYYKFDASGLSSGVYFYRLKAGDFIQTNKFILMK